MRELAKVKARIKALSEKTIENGCSEAEALAAADYVGKLLDQYSLSMDEIDVREQSCVLVEIKTGAIRRTPIDGCIVAIGRFCGVKVWHKQSRLNASAYCFYGFEPDTQMAKYLFEVIRAAMDTELAAFKRTETYTGRADTTSFKRGMAHRISTRLMQMSNRRRAEQERAEVEARKEREAPKAPTGTSLIVIKGQLIEQEFQKTFGIKLTKARSGPLSIRRDAYQAGQTAGDRVNLAGPDHARLPTR